MSFHFAAVPAVLLQVFGLSDELPCYINGFCRMLLPITGLQIEKLKEYYIEPLGSEEIESEDLPLS